MVRYRRSIGCLSTEQLHDLREAWAALYALPAAHPHSWFRLAGYHGEPSPYYCLHGAPGFLTWHRAYLLVFEQALQAMNPDVTLPYWNWSTGPTTGVPAACAEATYVNRDGDTVPNPLYGGPMPPGGPAATTARRSDIATTSFGDLATQAQAALTHADFASFQSALNSVHGSVHVRVGGQMSGVDWAGYDPIFYLHHANVDRLWASWQGTHTDPLPAAEAALGLDPFTRPCSGDFHTGGEMASTDALGYRYRTWCLIPLPVPVWEVVRIPHLPEWARDRLGRARLVLRSTRMAARSAELRVFVNEGRPDAKTAIDDNPHLAARAGVFGMRGAAPRRGRATKARPAAAAPAEPPMMQAMRMGERFDTTIDITRALRRGVDERGEKLTLAIVAVDPNGQRITNEDLGFETAELQLDEAAAGDL